MNILYQKSCNNISMGRTSVIHLRLKCDSLIHGSPENGHMLAARLFFQFFIIRLLSKWSQNWSSVHAFQKLMMHQIEREVNFPSIILASRVRENQLVKDKNGGRMLWFLLFFGRKCCGCSWLPYVICPWNSLLYMLPVALLNRSTSSSLKPNYSL